MTKSRLISEQRVIDENLTFAEYVLRIEADGSQHVRYKITDASGYEYDAAIAPDGTVYTGADQITVTWDCVATYEHWRAFDDAASVSATEKLMEWHAGGQYWQLVRDPNGEIYIIEDTHVGDVNMFIQRITTVKELAELVFHTFGERVILDLPRSGHMAVHVPADVLDELYRSASDQRMSTRDLIVERLGEPSQQEEAAKTVRVVERLDREAERLSDDTAEGTQTSRLRELPGI